MLSKLVQKKIFFVRERAFFILYYVITQAREKGRVRTMTKKICDITEVASYLQVSVSEVRKLVRSKRIPHFRIGNRLKFDLIKINSWLDDLEAQESKKVFIF